MRSSFYSTLKGGECLAELDVPERTTLALTVLIAGITSLRGRC